MTIMKRYCFKTKSVDDFRPLIDMAPIGMPWWCTGTAGNGNYCIIVCYLPDNEDLHQYWDDAYQIEVEDVDKIVYTDRFSKPNWLK